jgi:hypothetical protein
MVAGAAGGRQPAARMVRDFIDAHNPAGAVGKQFTVPSYASTALGTKDPLWGVWDLVIYAPAGTPGAPADMVTQHPGEAEWTMMRNMRYQVRQVENLGGRWRVHVDVVGKWDAQGRLIPDFALPIDAPGGQQSDYAKRAIAEYLKLNGR